MVKKAVQIGDSRVRAKSKDVTLKAIPSKKVRSLIKDLTDSMRHYGLVGMAAPQIGVNLNVFVTEIRKTDVRKKVKPDPLRVFINPAFVSASSNKDDMVEGCGSVDYGNIFGPVRRSVSVKIKARDEEGKSVLLEAEGLLAQILQHEYDHLQGVLCIDKFTDTRKITHKEVKNKSSSKLKRKT